MHEQCLSPKPTGIPFTMLLPPPNVTGVLHIGHALTVAVQDTLARWRRMRGDSVQWIPGLDHAGIATQTVVEKRLLRDRGLTRYDLGREAFLDEAWAWNDAHGRRILEQLRALGASLDWDSEFFTLDERRSQAVNEAFVRLADRGLIFRGLRMVSWCPRLGTVLSDVEVEHQEIDGPTLIELPGETEPVEVGVIETFAYPLDCKPSEDAGELRMVEVATTRLETMLGDVAVAVHPDCPRLSHLARSGRSVVHPFTGRQLPIIADAALVDPELGTGAVKITPAHDPADFACAERHGLPIVPLLGDDGAVLASALEGPDDYTGPAPGAVQFVGMGRFAARRAVARALDDLGLYRGKQPHALRLARCGRSGDVLEPMLRPQWFLKAAGPSADAAKLVEEQKIAVSPEAARGEWTRWLKDPPDWCLSRQLWWGHRVPAWKVTFRAASSEMGCEQGPGKTICETVEQDFAGTDGPWIVARCKTEAIKRAVEKFGVPEERLKLVQDDDVLDTWFSSGLLPLSALGWPQNEEGGHCWDSGRAAEPPTRYPLSVLETGSDILFFWVARMAMLCNELTGGAEAPMGSATQGATTARTSPGDPARGQPPFERILLHPMVRDRCGRKMSKSLGNVIDPTHVIEGVSLEALLKGIHRGNLGDAETNRADAEIRIEYPEGIPACGSDALRLTLLTYLQQGNAINLDLSRVVAARQFCNKMWQATRFAQRHTPIRHPAVPLVEQWATAISTRREAGVDKGTDYPSSAFGEGLLQRWILSRLCVAAERTEAGFEDFDMASAARVARSFFVNDLCGTYIEWVKPTLSGETSSFSGPTPEAQATLHAVLEASLRLLHPMMPFITEELWQALEVSDGSAKKSRRSIMQTPFPSARDGQQNYASISALRDLDAERHMAMLTAVHHAVLSLRKQAADLGISTETGCRFQIIVEAARDSTPSENTLPEAYSHSVHGRHEPYFGNDCSVNPDGQDLLPLEALQTLRNHAESLRGRCSIEALEVCDSICGKAGQVPQNNRRPRFKEAPALSIVVTNYCRVVLPIALDDASRARFEAEERRLAKRRERTNARLTKLRKKADSARYLARAPEAVRQKDQRIIRELEGELRAIESSRATLNGVLNQK
jgi:valyl-tRNA synthetase